MSILMAALTPHPPLVIPEIGKDSRKKAKKTINSLKILAEEIKGKNPDIIITISPHGPVFTDAISILDLKELEGDFSEFACPEVKIKVQTDKDFIQNIRNNAQKEEIEVITLSSADLERYNYPARLDHGVLVPLYFVKNTGLDVPVIPITMGLLEYEKLYKFGEIIENTINEMNLNAVIIASGDLSHRLKPGAPAGFNPHGEKFDRELIELLKNEEYQDVLNIEPVLIEKAGECGLRPLVIMLGALSNNSFNSEVKSYEGPFGVGYGVVGFYPEKNNIYLNLARETIKNFVLYGKKDIMEKMLRSPLPVELNRKAGTFVSIKKKGQLRGCIGTISPSKDNIAEEIISNSISAASRDPRFPVIKKDELSELDISVDVLGKAERVEQVEDLDPYQYGIIVEKGFKRGVLLPNLEGVDTVAEQLDVVIRKAGLDPIEDLKDLKLYRFRVRRYK